MRKGSHHTSESLALMRAWRASQRNSPESNAKRRDSVKASWEDPEVHAARSAALKGVAGRKLFTNCGYCGDLLPLRIKGQSGPKARFCSSACSNASYREYHLHSQYGMSNAEYDEMLRTQCGVCAVCGSTDAGSGGRGRRGGGGAFHVDHDHKTGKVRGLVCGLCNRMLGQSRDDPAILRAGAAYLEG